MIMRINGQALSSWLKYQPSNVQSKAVEIAVSSQTGCNKDMGFYPSSILFTFHYLAFLSHDSFPYLSVGSHVTIYLLTPLPPLHLLLLGCIISQLISIGKWYCVLLVTDTVTPRGQVSAQLIRADLIRSAVTSLPVSVSNLLRISEAIAILTRICPHSVSFPLFPSLQTKLQSRFQLGLYTIDI